MQATTDVAATVGFSKVTVADIASTARVGRRTFSWYFEDKHAAFELPDPGGERRATAKRIAGGLYEVGYSRTLRREAHARPSLIPELVETVLTPYLGVEGARRASREGALPGQRERRTSSAVPDGPRPSEEQISC